ncbi:MAG: type II toxin-antitoxin system Phd/YefM family antitoxin [Elusimicrobia bacterium]|nr:type II toxin-antitoxin system Phd/YefM family antitoxin [Elusimicrobiota bacterium]
MRFINTVTLKNDTNKVIRMVVSSQEPAIVTQHGHPAVAIVPIRETDLVLKHEKTYIKAIGQGLKDIKKGRTGSLKPFLKRVYTPG